MARAFDAGDRVLLVDAKRRRLRITLAAGGEFQTHAGVLPHDSSTRAPGNTSASMRIGPRSFG